ncbi:MAG: TonB-dependent receptor [Bacteroidia bacterium]|nr:TonB-dependent receptor [Bacteroidia bacterium]
MRVAFFLLTGTLLWAQTSPDDTLGYLELDAVTLQAERVPLLRPLEVRGALGGELSLGELLRSTPGVDWIQTGALTGRPVLRGHSYTRVLWLFGGLPREGAYWGEDHGYESPPTWMTFQPEVLLGPQSVRYGSDAIGGVLRFQPLIPQRSFLKGEARLYSNPLGGMLQVASARGTPDRFLLMEGIVRTAENFHTPRQGYVWNTGLRGGYGAFSGRLSHAQGLVEFAAFFSREGIGLPSPIWDSEEQLWFSETQQRLISRREAWRFQRDLPFQRITTAGGQMRTLYAHKEGSTTTLLVGLQMSQRAEYGENATEPEVCIETQRLDVDMAHSWRTWEGGVTGFFRRTTDRGEAPFLPRIWQGEGGVWLRRAWALGLGRIAMGARLHGATSKAETAASPRTLVDWAAELAYERKTWIARLTRSFRIPHPAELWANGYHEGAKRYELGRKNLPSEVAWTGELTYRVRGGELRPFVQYFPRYLFVERLPDTLPTAVGAVFTYGVRAAWLIGAEGEWQYRGLIVGLSYVQGEFLRSKHPEDRFVPRMPPLRLQIRYQVTGSTWSLTPEVLFYASQLRVYALHNTEVRTPGYFLVNIAGSCKSLSMGVQNLLGARYQSHLSLYRQWVPGGIDFPGRSFFVRLSF